MKKIFLAGWLWVACSAVFAQTQEKDLSMQIEKLNTLLFTVDRFYTDSVSSKKLVDDAIVKILEDLDPHSVYIPKEELQAMNEPLVGNFDGIGVEFNILKDTILVVNPIAGGPSEKLGIKAGDKIVKVDGENVAGIGIKNSDVTKKLRGPKGTTVVVSISREGEKKLLDFEIVRDKIPIYSIEASYMAAPHIGYIKVSRFAATTIEEFRKALVDLKAQGMESLILDLQGNGGGYLKTAIDMADELLSDDKLIVYTEGRSYPKEMNNASYTGQFEKGKLVVLIDEGSASASEIVSGAIQDWDRGMLIGRRSFGKGLVQKPFMLPDGSAVRLTISRYYTPSGRCIQKPYDEGLEAYYKEKYDRYSNGELFNMDSIHVPDSLKYFTNNKRIVYGGGGILPDVFVPVDTSENSEYFSAVMRKGSLNQFALEYLNKNRNQLIRKYPTVQDFVKDYTINYDLQTDMTNYFANDGIAFVEKDYKRSKRWFDLRFKAVVARNLYDNSAFYYVINELNESYQKAVDVLKDGTYGKMKLAKNAY